MATGALRSSLLSFALQSLPFCGGIQFGKANHPASAGGIEIRHVQGHGIELPVSEDPMIHVGSLVFRKSAEAGGLQSRLCGGFASASELEVSESRCIRSAGSTSLSLASQRRTCLSTGRRADAQARWDAGVLARGGAASSAGIVVG